MKRLLIIGATLLVVGGSGGSAARESQPLSDTRRLTFAGQGFLIEDADARFASVHVSETRPAGEVRVSVRWTHPDNEDVTFALEHVPSETRALLVFEPQGSGGDVVVASDGGAPVPGPDGTVAGRIAPTESLAAFAGVDPSGEWRLWALDSFAGDNGRVHEWAVELDVRASPAAAGIPAGDGAAGVLAATGAPILMLLAFACGSLVVGGGLLLAARGVRRVRHEGHGVSIRSVPLVVVTVLCVTAMSLTTPAHIDAGEHGGGEFHIERISRGVDGGDADGPSFESSLSGDGRYAAFESEASNLVAGDTKHTWDIFVEDRQTGNVERVSVASDGSQLDGDSRSPSITAGGRYVAFLSDATNLVASEGVIARPQAYVHDRNTGRTERVSVASDGGWARGTVGRPAISPDGRFVAFASSASNLVAGDTNGRDDVFVHDRLTRVTSRVSVSSEGSQADGDSSAPAISEGGRTVAFHSLASNLVADDSNADWDVFVHDLDTAVTERVSVASDGSQGTARSLSPSISADGRRIAFVSRAPDLVTGDTNDELDAFVHDRDTGATRRVSISSEGAQGRMPTHEAAISGDGRHVAFTTASEELRSDDQPGGEHLYVRDIDAGTTRHVDVVPDKSRCCPGSMHPAISRSGRHISFSSYKSNLVQRDTNEVADVFISAPAAPFCPGGPFNEPGCPPDEEDFEPEPPDEEEEEEEGPGPTECTTDVKELTHTYTAHMGGLDVFRYRVRGTEWCYNDHTSRSTTLGRAEASVVDSFTRTVLNNPVLSFTPRVQDPGHLMPEFDMISHPHSPVGTFQIAGMSGKPRFKLCGDPIPGGRLLRKNTNRLLTGPAWLESRVGRQILAALTRALPEGFRREIAETIFDAMVGQFLQAGVWDGFCLPAWQPDLHVDFHPGLYELRGKAAWRFEDPGSVFSTRTELSPWG